MPKIVTTDIYTCRDGRKIHVRRIFVPATERRRGSPCHTPNNTYKKLLYLLVPHGWKYYRKAKLVPEKSRKWGRSTHMETYWFSWQRMEERTDSHSSEILVSGTNQPWFNTFKQKIKGFSEFGDELFRSQGCHDIVVVVTVVSFVDFICWFCHLL